MLSEPVCTKAGWARTLGTQLQPEAERERDGEGERERGRERGRDGERESELEIESATSRASLPVQHDPNLQPEAGGAHLAAKVSWTALLGRASNGFDMAVRLSEV